MFCLFTCLKFHLGKNIASQVCCYVNKKEKEGREQAGGVAGEKRRAMRMRGKEGRRFYEDGHFYIRSCWDGQTQQTNTWGLSWLNESTGWSRSCWHGNKKRFISKDSLLPLQITQCSVPPSLNFPLALQVTGSVSKDSIVQGSCAGL